MIQQQSLPLNDLYQVLLGKQMGYFRTPAAESVDATKCLTLVGSKVILNLEAERPSTLNSWLFGLNAVLAFCGRKTLLETESESDPSNPIRSFTIYSPGDSMMSASTYQSTLVSSSTHLSHFPVDIIHGKLGLLKAGADFTSYQRVNRVPERVRLHIFYDDAGGPPALYWCQAGEHKKIQQQSLPLYMITDIFVGKQTSIFTSAGIASSTPEDVCFSIKSKGGGTLNIQASSEKERQDWVQGLVHLLRDNGSSMYEESPAASASNTTRRFSLH